MAEDKSTQQKGACDPLSPKAPSKLRKLLNSPHNRQQLISELITLADAANYAEECKIEGAISLLRNPSLTGDKFIEAISRLSVASEGAKEEDLDQITADVMEKAGIWISKLERKGLFSAVNKCRSFASGEVDSFVKREADLDATKVFLTTLLCVVM